MSYQKNGPHDALMAAFGNCHGGMNQLAYSPVQQGDTMGLYANALQNMLAVTPAKTKLDQAKNYVKEHGHNPGVLDRWMRSRGK